MRKALKVFGFITFTAILIVIVVGLAFYHLVQVGEFRRFLIGELERKTDLRVQLGKADLEIGRILGIAFSDVALSEPGAAQPAVRAERVTARVALRPLLQRKVIFYEVRLHKPTVQIVRDKAGHIPVLDKLLNLPFLKQQDAQFNLDLRSIKINDAEVELLDQRAGAVPAKIRLRGADIEVQRLRDQRLREFVKDLVRLRQAEPQGPALEFEFSSTVEKNGKRTTVRARGRLIFPKEAVEFHKAWWRTDVQLINVPASMMQDLTGIEMPLKSVNGHFAQRLHVEGNPAERLRLNGDLEFKQLAVDAPDLFLAPLPVGDGRVDYEVDWTPQRLLIGRLDYRANQIKFSLNGEVRSLHEKDPHFQVQVSALAAPLAHLRKFLPLKAMESSELENLAAALEEGDIQLKKAGVDARLSEIRAMNQVGIDKLVWFDAELRNVRARLRAAGSLPLQGVQGIVTLEKGVVAFRNAKGYYGKSSLSDLDGTYHLSGSDSGALNFQGRGELDIAELREQLKLGVFPVDVSKLSSSIQEVGGKGRVDFVLRRPAAGALQLEGKGALDNARLRLDDLNLSEIKGDVSFSPKEIRADNLKGLLFGSPVQIQLTAQGYMSENGSFDLRVASPGVKAGVVTHLLLDTGSLQDPGVVRGSVRYQGFFGKKEGRKFTGQLDLGNVQLSMQPLLQPLKELNGRIRIDEQGIDFQNLKGLLAGFPASVNGRWRYSEKPQLQFAFTAPNLDIIYLISQIDPESSEFYAELQAEGRVNLQKGRLESFEFSDLTSAVAIDHRVWRLTNLAMRAAGGTIRGTATIADKPETLEIIVEPKIQGVPIQSFLGWFDITTSEMTGKVNLAGNIETVGKDGADRKRNLNGGFNLRIEDGTLHRLRILVQILNLLDLSRWFTFQVPDLKKQGIRFRAITGDFTIKKGVYSTENLLVDSNDLRMTGAGKIDVPKNEIDFVVAVRPFAGIDTAINYIPLIGRGIAAIKNSFMVASFNIKGPIDDPTITPAPLSTLSEVFLGVLGIPKNLIGLGGENNPNESTDERSSEPAKGKAPGATR